MPWADEDAPATPAPQPAPAGGRWATPDEESAPAPVTAKSTAPEPEMPSAGTALAQGVGAGLRHAGESIRVLRGLQPESSIAESPAAAPLEWSDIYSPVSKGLPKLAYGLGESAPTLAAGIAGGIAGSAVSPGAGTLIGGAAGAGLGAALQSVGPYFGDELKKSPNDPDGAWTRAMERAGTSGAFSALGWAAFPARLAEGPLKQAAFQAFGVQPAISASEQVAQNVIQGKPATEGVGGAYARGAVGAAIPAAGHAILGSAFKERESIQDTRAQDPVLSRLGDPEGKSAGWIPDLNRLYTAVKDDLHPWLEAENYLADGREIPPEQSPYIAARLTRGSYGVAEHMLEHGMLDPVTREKTGGMGLYQVLEPVMDNLDGFRKYMMSRRAVELDGRGIETGIPIRDASNFVKQNPQFAKPFENWVNYQRGLLNYMTKAGVIGKDNAQAMMDANKDYTPFYRLMEDPQQFFGGPGAGLKVRNPIRGISGSERQILDPIESTIRNTYLYVSLADRNMALQKLQALRDMSPRGDDIMPKMPPEVHPVRVTPEEVEAALRRQAVTFQGDPEQFTIFRPNAFRPQPDQIRIFNDGKPTTYKVDPYFGASVNGLDREAVNNLTKMLAAPARLLRAGATLSPEFIARNPIRDQFSAFVFSTLGRGYVPFYDLMLGAGQVLAKGEGYQRWLASGGANSAMVSIDRNYVENLVRKMSDPSLVGTMKNVVRSPLDLLRAASEVMENATRVGEHMRLTKAGLPWEAAGYGAREVTLDFQRIGAKMRAVNQIIAFFNAQVEGVDRAARAMIDHPFRFAATVGAGITLPSLGLWAANKDDPRMKEIPRWEKDIFWIVPTDNWQPATQQEANRVPQGYARQRPDGQWEINKGNIYRIPKPFELGVAFGSVPERIMDAYYSKDPKAFKNVFSSIQQAFLPNFVPNSVSPIIEQFSNRSLFTDRPLVPQYLQDMLPKYQSNPYTTDTAKAIGNFISKIPGIPESLASPIIVENYIRAWTGGLGLHALALSDGILQGTGVAPTKISPTLTNADKTLIKAFSVRFPEAGANSIQDFYEEYNKRAQVAKTVKYLKKTGEAGEAQDLLRDNVIASAEGIHKAIGAQLKMVRDVYRNPKMSPDEKRNFIDMSYLQMIKMAQTGNVVFQKTADLFKTKKEQNQ